MNRRPMVLLRLTLIILCAVPIAQTRADSDELDKSEPVRGIVPFPPGSTS
ncbi:hypothetical protein [Burkholderia sp. L27(2015)]|nr:hypothetical protein [Burkholderia sp. L27(2015)]